MALFGSSRDVSFVRRMNREVMGNVISQQCAFYKYRLAEPVAISVIVIILTPTNERERLM